MQLIAEYLKRKVLIIEREKTSYVEKAYEIRTDNFESKVKLFEYLNKFPLFGYKYYAQLNIEKIHLVVANKEHLTIEGKNKIKEYNNFVKYDSTLNYTWDHLNKFYNN
uniref:Homing endonuclease LAGLIDADG domain-containing protein n=1 Tax=Orbilia brochopaga TaxID=3140254 RepID=A0A4Y5MZA7_9PEZI|nr:hypothetical protein [Drechslerella brochopaga]